MTVTDSFNAASDPALPTVAIALDPIAVKEEFKRGLPRLAGKDGRVKVKAITVIRHKPGRRCVIEYDLRIKRSDGTRHKAKLIGKVRARRFGNEGYRLLDAIWNAGFSGSSPDGISVPEPIGVIPRFQIWFQRKVPGAEATLEMFEPGGVALARRIAEGLHKLHRAGVPAERHHTIADELRILREHLPQVAEGRPQLKERIDRLLGSCDRLAATVPEPKTCGIHRDFYPAQVMVEAQGLFFLDFDLYCQGDPALDVGNFLGHLMETSLRRLGKADALADRERAMTDRFVELAGESVRPGITAYTTLTIVRHIYLSTRFPDRVAFTLPLLKLCEERLAVH